MSRRVVLLVEGCCQLINGSGGDRCTEAVAAMIDKLYKLGPLAAAGKPTEEIMLDFTRWLNHGSIVSKLENIGIWFGSWLSQHTKGAISLQPLVKPSYNDIVQCINRQHVAIAGFDDYRLLRLVGGGLPWPWANREHPNLGHVVLVVGYDLDKQSVVVLDPLRLRSGQPADYSWASFQAARFSSLSEVRGPAVALAEGTLMDQHTPRVPQGWSDDGHTLKAPNGQPVILGFRDTILASSWDAKNVPLGPEEHFPGPTGTESRQVFLETELRWNSKDGVFVAPIGQELLAQEQQVAALKKQLADLTQQQSSLSGTVKADVQELVQEVNKLARDANV
jgi:hypothetical protein